MTRSMTVAAITAGAVALGAVALVAQRPAQTTREMKAVEHIAHLAAAGDPHAAHALMAMAAQAQQPVSANASLPADDAGVIDRLAKSPRKGEFVTIMVNGAPMRTWVVRPQGQGRAPVVVVIQEIFGLSDWIRGVADQLAADGFVAVAPDLLAGRGANGGDSTSFTNQKEMMQAHFALPQPEIVAKLKAAREFGLKQPNANGRSATIGFCFGGNQSFLMAIEEPSLNAAVVYYGTAPADAPPAAPGTAAAFVASDRLKTVKAPVLGLYGGLKEDARVTSTVAATQDKMKQLGKTYDVRIYEGAAHGFLRAQAGNNGANLKATQDAWPLTVNWIRKYAS